MIRIGGDKLYMKISEGELILVYEEFGAPKEYVLTDEERNLISSFQKSPMFTMYSGGVLNRNAIPEICLGDPSERQRILEES